MIQRISLCLSNITYTCVHATGKNAHCWRAHFSIFGNNLFVVVFDLTRTLTLSFFSIPYFSCPSLLFKHSFLPSPFLLFFFSLQLTTFHLLLLFPTACACAWACVCRVPERCARTRFPGIAHGSHLARKGGVQRHSAGTYFLKKKTKQTKTPLN